MTFFGKGRETIVGSAPEWIAPAILLGVAIVFGGGTYQRSWPDAVVQLASLPVLFASLWSIGPRWADRRLRGALALIALILAVPLLQLLPLPPSVWTLLPGRALIAETFEQAGVAIPWFPISLSPAETARSALGLLPALAIFLSTIGVGRRARRMLTLVLIGLGFFSVIIGLAQVVGGADGPFRLYGGGTAAVGFFINQNHYAALLYTLVPFSAAWAIGLLADRRPEMIVGVALSMLFFVSLLIGLGTAQSRAGIILAMLGAFSSVALTRTQRDVRKAWWSKRLIFLGAVAGVLSIVQIASIGMLRELERDPLADDRWTFTAITFGAARDFLPFGSGFGTFDSVYDMYESVDLLESTYVNNAHNDYAEAFLEGGIGAAVVLALFLIWFLTNARRVWTGNGDSERRVLDTTLSRAATISIVLLLLHSAVDYPLRSAALSAIFAFSCALILPAPRRRDRAAISRLVRRSAFFAQNR